MKVFIAVPTYENITPDTFKSIYGLDPCGNWLVFDFVRGYDCATARNRIARQTLDEGADYVLMVDNDVVLPSDALRNLLEEPVDVCLGYYAHRDYDNIYRGRTCVCKLYDENGERHFNYPMESEYTDADMRALRDSGVKRELVHGGGMGCALVNADVFRRIGFPWYEWITYRDGGALSEDLAFCEKCRKSGIPIYVDPRVACGHLLRHVQGVM